MKILVTGALGFIGEFVIHELLRRGHYTVALARSPAPDRWVPCENLEIMQIDLRSAAPVDLEHKGVEVAIHLAAATKGPAAKQFDDTVVGTRNLLAAARRAGIRRIIGVSSIAVLDYRAVAPMTVIDEDVARGDGRGVGYYASAKIQQEMLFADFGREPGNGCTILRPGLVYDESHLSAAHAGIIKGPLCLLASHRGEVPTVEVQGVARAIANAAERHVDGCEVIHLVDDELPGQRQYLTGLRRRGLLPHNRLVVPWLALRGLCVVTATACTAFGVRRKLPDVLRPRSFSARLKPFRFSNTKAKRLLDWTPGRVFV